MAHDDRPSGNPQAANPASLTMAQLARVLGISEAAVQQHIADGAPIAPNGTVNLAHWAAWLNRKLKEYDVD